MAINNDEILAIGKGLLEELMGDISSNIVSKGRNATGKTKKSLHIVMYNDGGALLGRQWFRGLEIGRDKGKVPYQFDKIIMEWMVAKGIVADDMEKASRAIAWKIHREGTRRWKHPQCDVFTPPIEEIDKKMRSVLAMKVTKRLSDDLKKEAKNG